MQHCDDADVRVEKLKDTSAKRLFLLRPLMLILVDYFRHNIAIVVILETRPVSYDETGDVPSSQSSQRSDIGFAVRLLLQT